MTSPVCHTQFQFPGADTPMQAGAMWRGAMIDRCARLEAIALDCLVQIATESNAKPASYVTWQRFDRLREALEPAEFAPLRRKMLALLDAIEAERDLRTGLAHGTMKTSKSGVALNWHAWKGGQWNEASIRQSWLEALERACCASISSNAISPVR